MEKDIISEFNLNEWNDVFGWATLWERQRIPHIPTTNDINGVIAYANGIFDCPSDWVGLFRMKNNKYLYISGGCNYDQEWGEYRWYETLDKAIVSLSIEEHARLDEQLVCIDGTISYALP